MNLYTYISRVERADEPVKDGAVAELRNKEGKVTDLQEDQHHTGLDRFGDELGRYSNMTEILSGGRKRSGELFDLHDTGDFHRNLYIDVSDDGSYELGSRDYKEDLLEDKLTKRIWGLSNIQPIWEIVLDGIINELNKLHR